MAVGGLVGFMAGDALGEEGGLTSTISSRPQGAWDIRAAAGSVPAGKNMEVAIDARPGQAKRDARLSWAA
jgi:hypothetical protein